MCHGYTVMTMSAPDAQPDSFDARPVGNPPFIRISAGKALPHMFVIRARLGGEGLRVEVLGEVGLSGHVRIARLVIEPSRASGTLTARAIRGVSVERLVQRAAAELAEPCTEVAITDRVTGFTVPSDPDHAFTGPERWRSRGSPQETVVHVAEVYNKALGDNDAAPAVAVVNDTGYSRSQVARYVRAAREQGLIPPVGQRELPKIVPQPHPTAPPAMTMSDEEFRAHQEAVQRLVNLGIISTANPRDDQGRELRAFDPGTGEWLSVEEQERRDAK